MGNQQRKYSVVTKQEKAVIEQENIKMKQSIMATANNTFGLNLFKVIHQNLKGKNVFMSPLSISAVLSMAQIGAREKTALEMAQVLGWKVEDGEKIHKLFKAYMTSLQQPSELYQLSVANRIYLEQTYPVLEEFKNKTEEWYLSEPVQVNFKENAETEATKINSWVEEQTQDLIKDLFGPGDLTSDTRMVLVNAIYFKGPWVITFEKEATRPSPFKLAPGQTKEVPMMTTEERYGYYENKDLKFVAVELLYKGLDQSMIIIVPNEDFGLEELVEKCTPETLNTVIVSVAATKRILQLFLPKFEITSSFRLKQALSSLGMSDAFNTSTADFTGMTDQRDLVLSEVVHKAFVKVNEEGTEAAAASRAHLIEYSLESEQPSIPLVIVDHPFLFAIIDKRASGSVLFLGQINDPFD